MWTSLVDSFCWLGLAALVAGIAVFFYRLGVREGAQMVLRLKGDSTTLWNEKTLPPGAHLPRAGDFTDDEEEE
jgi:hypothetical protein